MKLTDCMNHAVYIAEKKTMNPKMMTRKDWMKFRGIGIMKAIDLVEYFKRK